MHGNKGSNKIVAMNMNNNNNTNLNMRNLRNQLKGRSILYNLYSAPSPDTLFLLTPFFFVLVGIHTSENGQN